MSATAHRAVHRRLWLLLILAVSVCTLGMHGASLLPEGSSSPHTAASALGSVSSAQANAVPVPAGVKVAASGHVHGCSNRLSAGPQPTCCVAPASCIATLPSTDSHFTAVEIDDASLAMPPGSHSGVDPPGVPTRWGRARPEVLRI